MQRVAAAVAADPGDPNDAATICWTSGTEGKPKGVRRAHYDWIGFSPGPIDGPAITDADILLNPFPMINMAGINGMLLPWLLQGATLVQHHPFDPQTFFMQIAVERPTYTLVPPALLWQLLNNEELLAKVDLSSLTRVGSGSAPLQPAMVRGWQQKMGLSVINFFGSNEGVALLSSPEDFLDPTTARASSPLRGAGSGTVRTDYRARADLAHRPGERRRDHRNRDPGELRVGGPGVFPGYLHADQLASPFDDEGCFARRHVRDRRRPQPVPALRRPDLVIRGGMNIAPAGGRGADLRASRGSRGRGGRLRRRADG